MEKDAEHGAMKGIRYDKFRIVDILEPLGDGRKPPTSRFRKPDFPVLRQEDILYRIGNDFADAIDKRKFFFDFFIGKFLSIEIALVQNRRVADADDILESERSQVSNRAFLADADGVKALEHGENFLLEILGPLLHAEEAA